MHNHVYILYCALHTVPSVQSEMLTGDCHFVCTMMQTSEGQKKVMKPAEVFQLLLHVKKYAYSKGVQNEHVYDK